MIRYSETLSEVIGPVIRDDVIIDGRTFHILRPEKPDQLLDDPAVIEAFARDEYMPYWAELWPSARMLAKAVLREEWPPGLEALDLGCGLGLPGLAALAKGLKVVFSDYDLTSLEFAAHNAKLNGFSNFEVVELDWRQPPCRQFPLILASDLIYEARNVVPVVTFLERALTHDGECLLTDQDRTTAPVLRSTLEASGLHYATRPMRAGQPGLRVKGTLYRIRKSFPING